MVAIDVKLFAGLAERLGTRALALEASGDEALPDTAGALEAALRARWPALATCAFRVAVNRSYAQAGTPVAAGDEVALIPPVSGG